MTQLNLFTKHVMGDPPKTVNVITSNSVKAYDNEEAESLNKKIRFLSNQSVDSHHTYRMQGGIKVTRKGIMNGRTVAERP